MKLDIDQEFFREWFDRAKNEEDDIIKFFYYFVAFNYLYNSYAYQKDNTNGGDKNKMENFIETITENNELEQAKKFKDYSPYDLLEKYEALNGNLLLSAISEEEIKGLRTAAKSLNRENDNCQELQTNLDNKEIKALFINIYKVRCNLFHGSKKMRNPHDYRFIKESNIVLQDFLERFLE